jgi:4-diphosphocytidyl-2-C-methyl-D-erythritol kinase
MSEIQVHPHAKVNLGLRVLRRRQDGYHEIRTRFQTIDLRDEIEIVRRPRGLELEVSGGPVAADRSNLVLRAAEALVETRPAVPGARIRLTKRIPVGAGLGGGSSDAAATLLALNHLWNLDLGSRELARIGARLGADVPFFLCGGTALGTGIGDEIHPLPDLPPYPVCLAYPPFALATGDVYDLWDRDKERRSTTAGDSEACFEEGREGDVGSIGNDLQPIVLSHHPELAVCLERLRRAGAFAASLSGSGSSLFGLFREPAEADAAARRGDWGDVRAMASRLVARSEYQDRLGVPLPEDTPDVP